MRTSLRPVRTLVGLAVVLPLAVGGLASCSSADDGGGVRSESQVEADARAWDLAWSSCLRDEGVDAPDASADGGIAVTSSDDVDVEALDRATEACRTRLADTLGDRPVTAAEKASSAEFAERIRESNECLRGKGYEVADTTETDGGTIEVGGSGDIPPEVVEACGGVAGGVAQVGE